MLERSRKEVEVATGLNRLLSDVKPEMATEVWTEAVVPDNPLPRKHPRGVEKRPALMKQHIRSTGATVPVSSHNEHDFIDPCVSNRHLLARRCDQFSSWQR